MHEVLSSSPALHKARHRGACWEPQAAEAVGSEVQGRPCYIKGSSHPEIHEAPSQKNV